MASNSWTLCLQVISLMKDVTSVCFSYTLYLHSGLNRIMKPNQIKSVFGLHTISEFKGNAIETNAFEMDIQAIVTHPDYRCESAKDDIGKSFTFLTSITCYTFLPSQHCFVCLKQSFLTTSFNQSVFYQLKTITTEK